MKPCSCGKQLDDSATTCPGCGKTFKKSSGSSLLMVAILVIFIVMLGAMFSSLTSTNDPTPVVSAAQQAAKEKEDAEFQRAVLGAKQLRDSMRNPDSFKLSEALIMHDGAVCYDFRSQNGFGGMNASHAVLSPSGQFKSNEQTGFAKMWNTECGNKTGKDRTWEVGYAAGFHGLWDKQ